MNNIAGEILQRARKIEIGPLFNHEDVRGAMKLVRYFELVCGSSQGFLAGGDVKLLV